MHREYHPADMNHLRARAFGGEPGHGHSHDHDHHHHDHDHDHGPEDRRGLYGLTALMGLLIGGDVLFGWLGWDAWRAPGGVSLAFVAAVIGGVRIVYGAIDALMHRSIGADVALAQACLAALVIGQPFVAAEVVFIALVGEVLEAVTFDRTQRAIHRLLDQTPRTARVRRDGAEQEIPAGQVEPGDTVIIRPGERIPVDGPVLVGRSTVDQSALTGEAMPVDVGPGEAVYTGTVNQFGVIEVKADKVGHATTMGQVLKLVAEAQQRKAPLERAADRLARYFLPVVEVVAGLTLLAGYILGWPDVWLRAVAVLVVACPCALILATPAAVLASMAWLARHGVLIKGGAALERLAACDTFAFDKTGTLTLGRPELASLMPLGEANETELLQLAATAESASPHPLALAVARGAAGRGITARSTLESVALPGSGVSAKYEDAEGRVRSLLVGNQRLLRENGVEINADVDSALEALDGRGETSLIVVDDGRVIGLLGARDVVRREAHDVIHDLKHLNIKQIAILTGDRASAARVVAKKTHIKTVESDLLPADKARWVEQAQAEGRKVAMVGDGINDAPALAAAHVGIALGGIGADLAAEAGDLVVLGEPLTVLPDLLKLSRATVRIIRQNIIGFAFGLNAVAMGSAALGILGPVPAAILHQAGSFLVLLNAMRLLAFGDWHAMPPFSWFGRIAESVGRIDDRLDLGVVLEQALARWRAAVIAASVLGLTIYATWGWSSIATGEVGLVRRFGRFVGVLQPGLHFRWPPPFEHIDRVRPDELRSLEIGFRLSGFGGTNAGNWEASHGRGVAVRSEEEALLLTGDGQYVELAATAQLRLDSRSDDALRAFAFGVFDPETAVRPLAESAVRSVVARTSLESLLTTGRRKAEARAADLLQQRADAYDLGLVVAGVEFQDVHPPLPVLDAYRDVSRAGSERQRRRNEGAAYHAETVARARGQAAATVNRAEADRSARVERARAEADAFRYLADARSGHPGLNDHRLYWDMVADALAGKAKLIVDPGRARSRHLILNELPAGAAGLVTPTAPEIVGPPRPPR